MESKYVLFQMVCKKEFWFFLLVIFPFFIFNSCSEKKSSSDEQNIQPPGKSSNLIQSNCRIISPLNQSKHKIRDEIDISVIHTDSTIIIDSVQFLVDGKHLFTATKSQFHYNWNTTEYGVGSHKIRTICFNNDSSTGINNLSVILLSDILPVSYTYQIINTYPHDPGSYIQGLVFEDGFLIEGTGKYGESSLRKVKIETGEALHTLNLSSDLFGEGVTVYSDKIYQLTWKSRVGFVYNKESFNLLQKVYYPTDGWGITNDGKQLIMSDGTSTIYFLDPEYFTEICRIDVYDHRGPVININELEYIKGEIYGNIYGSDNIVRIDPKTGKVLGWINMNGLLSPDDKHGKIDVLNGIAYDSENSRLFVTGKYWPKLFEIKIKLQ